MLPPVNPAGRPQGKNDAAEPFVPDLSEGAETGVYLALLELLDEGLIITGDETILDANGAACRLLERDYRQLAGRPLAELFPSERTFLEARARLFIHGETRGILRVSLPGGEAREFRYIAAARMRPGIHALILSPDFPPSAEAGTTPSQDSLWPRLAAAVSQPLIVVDDQDRINAANSAALSALGVTGESVVGQPIRSRLDIRWPAADAPPFARLRTTSNGESITVRVLPGPHVGWRLLLLPPDAPPHTALPASSRSAAPGAGRAAADHSNAGGEPDGDIERHHFAAALRRAIERQQLELHFQPLVDARSGQVRAGEALLRWNHPQLGQIPYGRFIGAVRDGGLIARLGDWVLQAACRHASNWPKTHGRSIMVTVNIATEHVRQGDLLQGVAAALAASALPPDCLELDLDEQVLEEDSPTLAGTLQALAAQGVRLAIDDFGRGLCSIPRLKRHPLRALKLAPGLVRGVGRREQDEAIVEAIASMAAPLGLEVFARGVEDEAQQAFLCALDCHLQQGPLFGAPMSAAAFDAFLLTTP